MPSVVLLKHSRKIIVVKKTWCQGSNNADIINFGTRPGESVKIFFSPLDEKARADFEVQTRENFIDNVAACYDGFVLDNFGRQYFCI